MFFFFFFFFFDEVLLVMSFHVIKTHGVCSSVIVTFTGQLYIVKLQLLEHRRLVYCADSNSFLSPRGFLYSSRKHLFYHENVCCVYSLESHQCVHSTYNYFIEDRKYIPTLFPFASWSGAMINPQWLKLLVSRTNVNVPKNVRATEIRPYLIWWLFQHTPHPGQTNSSSSGTSMPEWAKTTKPWKELLDLKV